MRERESMNLIKKIGCALTMIGIIGIPGAIEFGEWICPVTFLLVGLFVYNILERIWYIDEKNSSDSVEHHTDHGTRIS